MAASIRRASLEDAAFIAQVHVRSWRSTYAGLVPDEYLETLDPAVSEKMFRRVLSNDQCCMFVGEIDERIVGFVSISLRRFPQSKAIAYSAQIPAIYVLEEHQRRGLGTQLLAEAAQWLLDVGVTSLVIWALDTNTPSRQFYKKLGGELLPDRLTDESRGFPMNEVAYGWQDLHPLANHRMPRS